LGGKVNFTIVDKPPTYIIEDNIFQYLVILHKDGTIDTHRTVKGGVYYLHRIFGDFASFEQTMPESANAIKKDREKFGCEK
jgi:hypothetical protein